MTRHEMPVAEQDSAWDELDERRDAAAFRALVLIREAGEKLREWGALVAQTESDEVLEVRIEYAQRDIEVMLKDLGE